MLDGKEQKGIWDAQSKDELCKVLMPITEEIILGTKHFDHHGVEWDIAYPIYLYGMLELLVQAFHGAKFSKKSIKVTIPEYQEVAVAIAAIATNALIEMSLSAGLWNVINAAKAGGPVSPLYQSEPTVLEKVKLFTSSVAKWNKRGWMFADGKYRYNVVTCVDKDLELIEELFTNNPELSAGELLVVLSECIDVQREQETPTEGEKDAFWHVRRVDSLWFFAKKLGPILKQLGWTDDLPITTFLE